MLGSPGFDLPDAAALTRRPLVADALPEGVMLSGAADEAGVLLCARDYRPPHGLTIALHPGAVGTVVVIGPSCPFQGSIKILGAGCTVVLAGGAGHPSKITALLWREGQLLFVGRNCTANGVEVVIHGRDRCVVVGEDCMFAAGTTLRASDMHGIVDLATTEQQPCHGDILLEPHVWVGQDAAILKNVRIGFGSIVGAKALVARSLPRFVLAGGIPAKVLRHSVTWNRSDEPDPTLLPRLRHAEALLRTGEEPPPVAEVTESAIVAVG